MKWSPTTRHFQPATEGEATSFEDVVLPHLDSAYNIARWLVGDATLAEDVVQDATLRALRYFDSYHGGNARAWFFKIIRHTAYEARTLRQRHAAASLDDASDHEDTLAALNLEDPSGDPEGALGRQEDHLMLHDALKALPVNLRECLVLHELEELSYKEIAETIGVPVGTVMSRLWRARQALMPKQERVGS